MQWFVVKVRTAFEKKVKAQLEEQIELKGLEDKFGRILVPIEEMVVARGEKKKRYKVESRIFPGYVFVEMSMDESAWHLVRSIPNVHGFVGGTKDKPSPIPKKEVQDILDRMEQSVDKPKPKTVFEVGEIVRINDGPFADFTGTVEDVNFDKSRLRVSVSIFGRATPVELSFTQVEKESS
jgi:transcriptional antiterminator NusG